jgi:ParB-like chromosome segregation protein Spo0J
MARDYRVESYLNNEGVSWSYVDELPLARIDVKRSLSNQARMGVTLDESMVERYQIAMKDGASFPAIVVHESGLQYVIVTGNHRTQAALNIERSTFDAYVVRTSDVMVLERITRGINGIEGLPPSKDELIAQAKYMVKRYGRPISEMARAYKLPTGTLERALHEDETRERIARMAMDPTGIPKSTLNRLSAIHNDAPLKVAVEAIRSHGLSEPMVGELIGQVRGARSEQEQVDAVAAFVERPDIARRRAETRNGTTRVNPERRVAFFRHVTALKNLLERYPTAEAMQFTDQDDVDRARAEWNDLNQQVGIFLTKASRGRLKAVGQ